MRILPSALLVACAWACAPAGAAPAEAHDANSDGVVFFSLPKNRPGDVFVLEAVSGGKQQRFAASPQGKDGPLGMHAWLPAGDYRLAAWNGIKLLDPPTLTIAAGRLTDGGSLIEFPVGDRKVVVLPVRPPETAHDIDAVLPELAAQLSDPEPLRWSVAAPPKPVDLPEPASPLGGLIPQMLTSYETHLNKATPHKRLLEAPTPEAFYAVAKESVPPLTRIAVSDADGRAYFGADFGQVRVRAANGEWSALDTGTLRVISVLASEGKRLLAGYVDGSIRASDDGGASWRALATPAPGWQVTGLEHVGERWVVATARFVSLRGFASPDAIRIFGATDADLKDLALVREFKLDEPMLVVPHAEHAGTQLYVNAGLALWRLDVGSGEWKMLPLPGDVADFHLGDPGVIATWLAKGIFSKLYVSKDDGGTWKKLDHPSLMITDIRMADPAHGVAVRLNPGAFSNTKEIYDYDAANDDWRLTAQAPDGCIRLLIDATHRPRYCVTTGASILALVDGKWVVEYSTQ